MQQDGGLKEAASQVGQALQVVRTECQIVRIILDGNPYCRGIAQGQFGDHQRNQRECHRLNRVIGHCFRQRRAIRVCPLTRRNQEGGADACNIGRQRLSARHSRWQPSTAQQVGRGAWGAFLDR
ncbi:hypothetical protein D3C81_1649020 [compost metagenome]